MSSQQTPAEQHRRGRKKAEEARAPAGEAEGTASPDAASADPAPDSPAPDSPAPDSPALAAGGPAAPAVPERKRLEEQLEALERRQAELRRALALADHPELADAVRALEARVDHVALADQKKKRGLSKAEEKKRDALTTKLEALRGKRAALDAQIGELERDLAPLGDERVRLLDQERAAALTELAAAVEAHAGELAAAGFTATLFVPELDRWKDELEDARRGGSVEVVS